MGKRYALCVGINRYQNATDIDLPFSVNDAKAVGQLLADKHRGAFEQVAILLDEQATKPSILASLNDYLRHPAIEPDDLIVFFFSGYGTRDPAGELCLMPHDFSWGGDGRLDLASIIRVPELATAISHSRTQNIILWVDCGYSDALGPPVSRVTRPVDAPLLIMGAALAAKPADKTAGLSHGLLTECLLHAANAAPNNGEWLTLGHVLELATAELMNFPQGQLVQGANPAIDFRLSLLKNPSYCTVSKSLAKGILRIFDWAGYKRVMLPLPSHFEYPNFFIASKPAEYDLPPKIAVLCLDNNHIQVTSSHINQFIKLAQQLQARHDISEAMIITQHSLATPLRRALRASDLCTWSTPNDLLRSLIGFDRQVHQLIGPAGVKRPDRPGASASTKASIKVKADRPTRNGAK